MRCCALFACVLAACSFRQGAVSSGDGDGGIVVGEDATDAELPVDAAPDVMPDASFCYGTGLVQPCFTTMPSGTTSIAVDIDTDTSQLCDDDPRNAAWCVIAGASVSVTGTVRATGTLPLVLVSTSSITIGGVLDASSKRGETEIGAGGNASGCSAGIAPTGANGGGAGGSFGGLGGNGSGPGAGTRGAVLTPTTLRGGCPGQNGGGGAAGGAHGNGGGAVYLIAQTTIMVGGSINASGAGAVSGHNPQGGGGGAGAGGMIGFDAPTVMVGGQAFANGGSGGEGGTQGGFDGANGTDPTTYNNAATTPNTSGSGGDGGSGSVTTTLMGTDGGPVSGGGGGGGGGGAGIVKLYRAASITGNVSPPPS